MINRQQLADLILADNPLYWRLFWGEPFNAFVYDEDGELVL